jgi:glycosyltransferase involved in cell wall biosynthesis
VKEPLLSIVTINRNDRAGLARTLASVDAQRFLDRELVVVDGASTDGSQDVVRSARPGLVTTFVSEPDGGIYDAQNKGLALARGTYCLFLNSGDALLGSDVLGRLLAGPPTEDLVYGDAIVEEPWGARRPWKIPDPITLRWLLRSSLSHPATAIRRSVFDAVGRYDTSLRVAGDYRFFLDALVNHGATTRHVAVEVAEMAKGGISTSPRTRALVAEERARVHSEVLSPVLRAHLAEQAREEALRPGALVRAAFRPLARGLRTLGRRLRGRPD